jgi:hypothetical protein
VTRTDNGLGAAVFWGADCPSPLFTPTFEGAPGNEVTENDIGATPSIAAATVFTPTFGPICHNPEDAIPFSSDVAVGYWITPPPAVTAKVTSAPSTGAPLASVTLTVGPGTGEATVGAAGGDVFAAIAAGVADGPVSSLLHPTIVAAAKNAADANNAGFEKI